MKNIHPRPRLEKILCALMVLSFSTAAGAEERPSPLLEAEYRFFPAARMAHPAPGEEGTSLALNGYSLKTSVPAPLPFKGGYGIFALKYSRMEVALSGFPGARPDFIGPLHSFSVESRFVRPLDESSSFSVILDLGYHGEASDWGFDAVKVRGGVLYETRPDSQTRIGYGAVYTALYGQPLPLPFFFYQTQGDDWRTDFAFPARLAFMRIFPEWKGEAGFAMSVKGDEYHVNEGTANAVRRLKFTSVQAGPAMKWRPAAGLAVSLDGGWSFYRKFMAYHGDTLIKDFSPEAGWYAALSAAWRF